jgi:hypothetical protein
MDSSQIPLLLTKLSHHPFRARFHIKKSEEQILLEKGMNTIRIHTINLITKRLAPALPKNDGKQTPYKGHPVFVAQHATATCCRSCLQKWHRIPNNRELTSEEIEYIADVIQEWLLREAQNDKNYEIHKK